MLVVFALVGIALAWAYSYLWQAGDITQQRSTTRSFLMTWVLLWVIGLVAFGYKYWRHVAEYEPDTASNDIS